MKDVLLKILKEIGIAVIILVVLAGVTVLAFKDQLPYDEVIREGDAYEKADLKNYSVSSSDRISEVEAITVTHEANGNQIIQAENDVRIQTGKETPFGTIGNNTDLPSEKVGVTINVSGDKKPTNNNQTATQNSNQGESLNYPVTDDAIKQIEKEQSEDAASAANRRFDNQE